MSEHVKFVSYTSGFPNLCSDILILEINEREIEFGCNYLGLLDVNSIPEEYQKYADEIVRVFNENVSWGCCRGCI